MDGPPAARALTRRARRTGRTPDPEAARIVVGVAGEDDEPEIRALLRETALPGSVRLSFEREPDSRAAGRIEGDEHAVLVARERGTGRLAAVATRSSRLRFVNGEPVRVGYLGGLRIARGAGRSRELLDAGFALCRRLHERAAARLCLASVVAGHAAARRRLERGGPGWPAFSAVDELVTLAIPARRAGRHRANGIDIVRGPEVGLAPIVDLLGRANRRYQFAPLWTSADLDSDACAPGLRLGDFLVAVRQGAVAGCAAVWDQRAFKQVVVRGYAPFVARWRAAINAAGSLVGAPRLPPPGLRLEFAHLSHLAVEPDDGEVAAALVSSARAAAASAGLEFLTLGLSVRHPLYGAVRRTCLHRSYRSVLYAACWPPGGPIGTLDARPSHPETAVL